MKMLGNLAGSLFRAWLPMVLLAAFAWHATVWAARGVAATATRPDMLSAVDRQNIQRIISLQIKAFERNDETLAFSYSTPEIRQYFGTSRVFMDMVRSGYSVLYINTSTEFLEAAVIDGRVVQPLRIVARNGVTLVALYTVVRQPNREWLIGGCELAPSTVQFI